MLQLTCYAIPSTSNLTTIMNTAKAVNSAMFVKIPEQRLVL